MTKTGLGILDKVLEWAVIASFSLMIMVVLIQVIARYTLPWSPHWTEELARFSFIYLVSLGAGLAIKDRSYVNVSTLLHKIKGRTRFYLDSFILLCIMVLMVIMFIYSIPLLEIVSLQSSAALQVNMVVIYFSMTCMSFLIFLYCLAELVSSCKNRNQSL